MPSIPLDDVRLIRLVWIGRLGDLLAATPFFAALRGRFPHAKIILFTGERGASAARLIADIDGFRVLGRIHSPLRNIAVAAELLRERADLLIDLNPAFSRSAWTLAGLSRARVKAAFSKKRGNSSFDLLIDAPAEAEHMLERYARLAAAFGAPYRAKLKVRVPETAYAEAERILTDTGLSGARPAGPAYPRGAPTPRSVGARPLLGVFPGNFKKFDNRWPEERFIELASRLKARGSALLFLAGPGEDREVRAIAARVEGGAPVASGLALETTAALLSRLDLLLTNATGTAHLAAAVGTPTVSPLSRYTRTVWMYPPESGHFSSVSGEWGSCRDVSVDALYGEALKALDWIGPPPFRRAETSA